MQKWEYKIVGRQNSADGFVWADANEKRSITEVLNALGQAGWELVSIVSTSDTRTKEWAGMTTHINHYLRRPVEP